MKKAYRLEGLGCASCAAKIEKEVGELPQVISAKVNFAAAKLRVEADKAVFAELKPTIQAIVKRHEAKTKVCDL